MGYWGPPLGGSSTLWTDLRSITGHTQTHTHTWGHPVDVICMFFRLWEIPRVNPQKPRENKQTPHKNLKKKFVFPIQDPDQDETHLYMSIFPDVNYLPWFHPNCHQLFLFYSGKISNNIFGSIPIIHPESLQFWILAHICRLVRRPTHRGSAHHITDAASKAVWCSESL